MLSRTHTHAHTQMALPNLAEFSGDEPCTYIDLGDLPELDSFIDLSQPPEDNGAAFAESPISTVVSVHARARVTPSSPPFNTGNATDFIARATAVDTWRGVSRLAGDLPSGVVQDMLDQKRYVAPSRCGHFMSTSLLRLAVLLRGVYAPSLWTEPSVLKPLAVGSTVYRNGDTGQLYTLRAVYQYPMRGVCNWSIDAIMSVSILLGRSFLTTCSRTGDGVQPLSGVLDDDTGYFYALSTEQVRVVQRVRVVLSAPRQEPILKNQHGLRLQGCSDDHKCDGMTAVEALTQHRVDGIAPFTERSWTTQAAAVQPNKCHGLFNVHAIAPLAGAAGPSGVCGAHLHALASASATIRGTRGYGKPNPLIRMPCTTQEAVAFLAELHTPSDLKTRSLVDIIPSLCFPSV